MMGPTIDMNRKAAQLNIFDDEFGSNIETFWKKLQFDQDFCDVTIACEGKYIQTHQVVLSSNSSILKNILKLNVNKKPLICIRNAKYKDVENMLNFMYQGEVNVHKDDLENLLVLAEDLDIKELLKNNLLYNEYDTQEMYLQRIGESQNWDEINMKEMKQRRDFPEFNQYDQQSQNIQELPVLDEGLDYNMFHIQEVPLLRLNTDQLCNEPGVQEQQQETNCIELDIKDRQETIEKDQKCNQLNFQESQSEEDRLKYKDPRSKIPQSYIKVLPSKEDPERNNINIQESLQKKYYQNVKGLFKEEISLCNKKIAKSENHKNSKRAVIKCFKCDKCSYQARDNYNYKRHIQNNHDDGSTVSRLPCDQCNYEAKDKSRLRDHIKSVHDKVRYPCSLCEYKAANKGTVREHIDTVHKGIRYTCDQCDYKGTSKDTLKFHFESIHEGLSYPCDQCDFMSTRKRSVGIHKEIIHSGNLLFCDKCDYKTKTKISLKLHVDSIHIGITHSCAECDFKTFYESSLKKQRH